jgi:hypothetical protein
MIQLVLDDAIKVRSKNARRIVTSDHTTGCHVMGQQVLTLGLSCAKGFVPIDSELFTARPMWLARARLAQHQVPLRHRAAPEPTKPDSAMIARHSEPVFMPSICWRCGLALQAHDHTS